MKRLFLILLACSSVLLAGCGIQQKQYDETREDCTTSGFFVQIGLTKFVCMPSSTMKICMNRCSSDELVDVCLLSGASVCD